MPDEKSVGSEECFRRSENAALYDELEKAVCAVLDANRMICQLDEKSEKCFTTVIDVFEARQESRWGDALTLSETALKAFPDSELLQALEASCRMDFERAPS